MSILYNIFIIKFFLLLIPLLIAIAYYTLCDRKIMAVMQRRVGPNVVGFWGLLQPLADGLKLFLNETIIPDRANIFLFLLAPYISFSLSLLGWVVIPFDKNIMLASIDLNLLYLLTISSLSIYGIIIGAWASNSKFSMLGGLRAIAQFISYEVSMGLLILPIIFFSNSLNLTTIVECQLQYHWYAITFFPLFFMFIITIFAETNRIPFDLPEAEAELVAGYNVEYSGMGFALYFLAEYNNMLIMSVLTIILFLGGYTTPFISIYFIPNIFWFSLKLIIFIFLFVWVRASIPRYRFDNLMSICWKIFLPMGLFILLFIIFIDLLITYLYHKYNIPIITPLKASDIFVDDTLLDNYSRSLMLECGAKELWLEELVFKTKMPLNASNIFVDNILKALSKKYVFENINLCKDPDVILYIILDWFNS